MSKLKIAIQKSGRLNEDSMQILKDVGISIDNGKDQLKASAKNCPILLTPLPIWEIVFIIVVDTLATPPNAPIIATSDDITIPLHLGSRSLG